MEGGIPSLNVGYLDQKEQWSDYAWIVYLYPTLGMFQDGPCPFNTLW